MKMTLEQHSDDSLKVVLLGPTGSGKSAIANVILDCEAFAESPTTECQAQQRKFKGRSIWVIDTPGLSESCEVRREIKRSSTLGPPAPTAFLFLVDPSEKTGEDWKTYLKLVEEIFGKDALMHVMVLFRQREKVIKVGYEKLLEICGNAYHIFTRKEEIDVRELLEKIKALMIMRIVLLGKTGAGKSATGNTILGKVVFKEDLSSDSVTTTCQKECSVVGERYISLVDTAGLFDTTQNEDQLKRQLEKCFELSAPGPHVFLLVIRLDVRFTEEENNAIKWIQENFGEGAARFTIVVFTHADQLKGKSVEDTLNEDLLKLTKSCRGGYHIFNNAERDDQLQDRDLLKKIDAMVKENRRQYYTCQMYEEAQTKMKEENERKRQENEKHEKHTNMRKEIESNAEGQKAAQRKEETKKDESEDGEEVGGDEDEAKIMSNGVSPLRILLLGKTGSGKSATGNAISGSKIFEEKFSPNSVTATCGQKETEVDGKKIILIDTPGLFDTEMAKDKLNGELEKCVELSIPGPHAFLLFIRLDVRFTEEENNSVKWIQENFGEGALNYTIVLLTHGDVLGAESVTDFLVDGSALSSVIRQCGDRYHIMNNKNEDRAQVSGLLVKIDTLIKENGGRHYTSEIYQEAQRKIRHKKMQKFIFDVAARSGYAALGALALKTGTAITAGGAGAATTAAAAGAATAAAAAGAATTATAAGAATTAGAATAAAAGAATTAAAAGAATTVGVAGAETIAGGLLAQLVSRLGFPPFW